MKIKCAWIGAALVLFSPNSGLAQEACESAVGEVVVVEGEVEFERAGTFVWQPAGLGALLCNQDSVRTGRRSRAAVQLINDAVLRLDQNTTLQLTDIRIEPEEQSFLDLVRGVLQSFSRKPRLLAMNTPYLNAVIEGTEFVIAVDEAQASITVLEGVVTAANDYGEARVASGESVVAEAGQAPQPRIVVRARDAVQWALYYPPIFATLGGRGMAAPPGLSGALAEATVLAAQGDVDAALGVLERVPEPDRTAPQDTYRAALLLSVGRVDEAKRAIDRALQRDPDSGLALAQRAIVEVVRNAPDQALADAERAVELNPEASAARIALSYAQQAQFRLEAARDTLLQATEANPDDPLAWARLSELWLMLGERRRAREAAGLAVGLAPDLARTQMVLGFAALAEFRTGAAREAFERAIALEPANPRSHLGLGLAQIRDGEIEAGRGNLELAVGLDSDDALLRAYLGKAYFEEKRAPLDAEQFAIAKDLDPLDPTAYLYDAIRKQTENRPGEALQDLQTSIELNDNRAVYRSRELLDQDRAARGTSLARIYDDLGFSKLGLREASKSLSFDPTNAAAHRFLSDSYRGVRRRENARVSELLQAQILQDLNINPIQPSNSETNLNVGAGGGPAEAGFNEFTPLFESRGAQVNATAAAGNNDTWSAEGVISMLYDRYSLSAGGFRFETDGWRDNGDIKHDIYNVYFQAAITPELNAQIEYRRRKSDQGDLDFNFDPDDFSPNERRDTENDIARVGLRYSPTPNSDFLLSASYSNLHETQSDRDQSPFGLFELDSRVDDEGYQVEGQYIYRRSQFNLIAGGAFSDIDEDLEFEVAFDGVPIIDESSSDDITHVNSYAYGYLNFPDSVFWTAGVSYVDFDAAEQTVDRLNPKFGAQWFLTPDLALRGAAMKTVNPQLVNNRTLEPTQVAGFNQLFDEAAGVKSTLYGVGLDWRMTKDLFVGAEAGWRDIDEPFFSASAGKTMSADHDEQTYLAYAYWTPLPEVAFSAEVVYDRFEAERSQLTTQGPVPEDLETVSVPIGVQYFHRSGFFAGLKGTYVHQDVDRSSGSFLADGSDDFFIVDAAIGWRFPKRFGVASLAVSNLFDQSFQYQDDSFREFQDKPSTGPYFPDRQILARMTLSW